MTKSLKERKAKKQVARDIRLFKLFEMLDDDLSQSMDYELTEKDKQDIAAGRAAAGYKPSMLPMYNRLVYAALEKHAAWAGQPYGWLPESKRPDLVEEENDG